MSRHHDKRASEYAATLGWEVTRTANGHARMKCPYGCCLIIASTRKNGGYKNSMTRIRKCPGAADAALVKNVVDEFLSGLPPDPAVVEAWQPRGRLTRPKLHRSRKQHNHRQENPRWPSDLTVPRCMSS